MNYYRHCQLVKGNTYEISWIPEKFAKVGDVLKLKQEDGTWDDGWVVESVGLREDENYVISIWGAAKRQRKASDLPGGTFAKFD